MNEYRMSIREKYLIESNMPLITAAYKHFTSGGGNEDLWQECLLYLCNKIKDYDETKAQLSTWIYNNVRYCIHSQVRMTQAQKRALFDEVSLTTNVIDDNDDSDLTIESILGEEDKEYKNFEHQYDLELFLKQLDKPKYTDKHRALIKDVILKGESYTDVAKKIKCSRTALVNSRHSLLRILGSDKKYLE